MTSKNFVIPKKKTRPKENNNLPPAFGLTSEVLNRRDDEFKVISNIIENHLNQKDLFNFLEITEVIKFKNEFREWKFNNFKQRTGETKADAEAYGFRFVRRDEVDRIARYGLKVGSNETGDIGHNNHGVYVYKSPDLALVQKSWMVGMDYTFMIFRTVRGKPTAVGVGSSEMYPTMNSVCHAAQKTEEEVTKIPPIDLHRENAFYHYELKEDFSTTDHPSGVLPYAFVVLRVKEFRRPNARIPPLLSNYFYAYELCPRITTKMSLPNIGETEITMNSFMSLFSFPAALGTGQLHFSKSPYHHISSLATLDGYDEVKLFGAFLFSPEVVVNGQNKQQCYTYSVMTSKDEKFQQMIKFLYKKRQLLLGNDSSCCAHMMIPTCETTMRLGLPADHTVLHVLSVSNTSQLALHFDSSLLYYRTHNEKVDFISSKPKDNVVDYEGYFKHQHEKNVEEGYIRTRPVAPEMIPGFRANQGPATESGHGSAQSTPRTPVDASPMFEEEAFVPLPPVPILPPPERGILIKGIRYVDRERRERSRTKIRWDPNIADKAERAIMDEALKQRLKDEEQLKKAMEAFKSKPVIEPHQQEGNEVYRNYFQSQTKPPRPTPAEPEESPKMVPPPPPPRYAPAKAGSILSLAMPPSVDDDEDDDAMEIVNGADVIDVTPYDPVTANLEIPTQQPEEVKPVVSESFVKTSRPMSEGAMKLVDTFNVFFTVPTSSTQESSSMRAKQVKTEVVEKPPVELPPELDDLLNFAVSSQSTLPEKEKEVKQEPKVSVKEEVAFTGKDVDYRYNQSQQILDTPASPDPEPDETSRDMDLRSHVQARIPVVQPVSLSLSSKRSLVEKKQSIFGDDDDEPPSEEKPKKRDEKRRSEDRDYRRQDSERRRGDRDRDRDRERDRDRDRERDRDRDRDRDRRSSRRDDDRHNSSSRRDRDERDRDRDRERDRSKKSSSSSSSSSHRRRDSRDRHSKSSPTERVVICLDEIPIPKPPVRSNEDRMQQKMANLNMENKFHALMRHKTQVPSTFRPHVMEYPPLSPDPESPASPDQDSPLSPEPDTPLSPERDTPLSPEPDTPLSPEQETPLSPEQETPLSPEQDTPYSPPRTSSVNQFSVNWQQQPRSIPFEPDIIYLDGPKSPTTYHEPTSIINPVTVPMERDDGSDIVIVKTVPPPAQEGKKKKKKPRQHDQKEAEQGERATVEAETRWANLMKRKENEKETDSEIEDGEIESDDEVTKTEVTTPTKPSQNVPFPQRFSPQLNHPPGLVQIPAPVQMVPPPAMSAIPIPRPVQAPISFFNRQAPVARAPIPIPAPTFGFSATNPPSNAYGVRRPMPPQFYEPTGIVVVIDTLMYNRNIMSPELLESICNKVCTLKLSTHSNSNLEIHAGEFERLNQDDRMQSMYKKVLENNWKNGTVKIMPRHGCDDDQFADTERTVTCLKELHENVRVYNRQVIYLTNKSPDSHAGMMILSKGVKIMKVDELMAFIDRLMTPKVEVHQPPRMFY